MPLILEALERTARARADASALKYKQNGQWQTMSWREYRDQVRMAGRALIALGLRPRDHVTIIARGRRVASGPVAKVLAIRSRGEFRVGVRDRGRASAVLVAAGATVRNEGEHLIVSGVTDPEWISSTLGRSDVWTTEIVALTPDLETVFLELTDESARPS